MLLTAHHSIEGMVYQRLNGGCMHVRGEELATSNGVGGDAVVPLSQELQVMAW